MNNDVDNVGLSKTCYVHRHNSDWEGTLELTVRICSMKLKIPTVRLMGAEDERWGKGYGDSIKLRKEMN